jgi:hypothetical protein
MQASKLICALILVFSVFVFAQNKQNIAIYVASTELKDAEKRLISTKILAPFVQSGKFTAIERGDAFLNSIDRERKKQRDGSVEDSQISQLGKEAGVKFVCIADLIDAFGIYSLSARLINTETAEIVGIGESEMKNLGEIGSAADEIYEQISSGKKAQKKPVASAPVPTATTAPVSQAKASKSLQDVEILKQTLEWQEIKRKYDNTNAFFNAARQGFSAYFKRYSPRLFSEDGETLIMSAKYGKYDVMCTFFIDMNSRYIVAIETTLDKAKQKWLANVVKEVEKLGKK